MAGSMLMVLSLLGVFGTLVSDLLLMMVAQVTHLQPYELVHTLGDAHIYKNHIEQVHLQLQREPKPLPQMHLNPEVDDIFGFTYDDFTLTGYEPYPHIKGDVSV